MSVSVKFRGREIESPTLRVLAAVGGSLAVAIALPLGAIVLIFGIMFLVATVLVSLPLHVALIAMGRRGFVQPYEDGKTGYRVNAAAFRSRASLK